MYANDLDWDVCMRWFWSSLLSVKRYCGDCQVIVTEHGLPDASDASRCAFVRHTASLLHHMPWVVGYTFWTLVDNVEWELGLRHFGVVGTDRDWRRVPRRSYYALQRLWQPEGRERARATADA